MKIGFLLLGAFALVSSCVVSHTATAQTVALAGAGAELASSAAPPVAQPPRASDWNGTYACPDLLNIIENTTDPHGVSVLNFIFNYTESDLGKGAVQIAHRVPGWCPDRDGACGCYGMEWANLSDCLAAIPGKLPKTFREAAQAEFENSCWEDFSFGLRTCRVLFCGQPTAW